MIFSPVIRSNSCRCAWPRKKYESNAHHQQYSSHFANIRLPQWTALISVTGRHVQQNAFSQTKVSWEVNTSCHARYRQWKRKRKKMYQRPSGLMRDWMRNQWRLYPEVATRYFMATFLSDIFEGSNHQTATFVREIRLSTPCQKFILICSHQASRHIYPSNSTSSPIALIKRFTFALFCAPSSGGKVLLALTFSITRSL